MALFKPQTTVEPAVPQLMKLILVLCALAALLPWFSGGQEPIAYVITSGLLLMAALLLWGRPELPRIGWNAMTGAAALWLAWATASLIWSVNRYDTVIWLIPAAVAIGVFALSYRLAALPGGRKLITWGYLASATVFSAYGIYLYLTGDYNRLTSSLYWANPAAAYLLPGVILAWDRASQAGRRRWFLPLSLVLLTAFWLTDSRGGMLVLALIMVLFLVLKKSKLKYCAVLVFIGLVSYGLSIGVGTIRNQILHQTSSVVPGSRFSQAASGERDISGTERLDFLHSAATIWNDHPWLGTGSGTYRAVHPQYQKGPLAASSDAHNWYAQVLAEQGLVGFGLMLATGLALLAGIWRGIKQRPSLLPWAAGIAALGLHFGIDIDASYPALLALLAVWLGLVWRPAAPDQTGRPSWLLPASLLLALAAASSLSQSAALANAAAAEQASGNINRAADDYARAHAQLIYDPETVEAEGINLYTLALIGQDSSVNLAQALDRAKTAMTLSPKDAQNYQLEARVLAQQNKLGPAADAYRQALKLDPYNHPEYALGLASILNGDHQPAAALVASRAMLAQYPKHIIDNRVQDPNVALNVVNLYLLQSRIEQELGDTVAAARDLTAAQQLYHSLPQ